MNTVTPFDIERLQIRPERPGDEDDISRITTLAFASMPYSSGTEARIVEALRAAGGLAASLVATVAGAELVGHIAFSPVRIDDRPGDWFALGPVSVAPHRQGRGVGHALVSRGLARLMEMGAEGCVLLGDPAYYDRFGFLSDPQLTYRGAPNRFLQRLVLGGGAAKAGDVRFDPAFDVP